MRFMTASTRWEPSLGAWPDRGGVRFRVWAPTATRVDVVLAGGDAQPLRKAGDGTFSAVLQQVRPGDRYRYRLDGGDAYPDPASRFQPDGVHGPSAVVHPGDFPWSDAHWAGVALERLTIYELHIGTFTSAGTFTAAAERLPALRELGVSAIELMPVADFPGERNWGYDGVSLFAPARCYGTPEDLRGFVDRAHGLGLGVYLDVVYNHLGPDGACLSRFSPYYFSPQHQTPWGAGVNLDGEHSAMVRGFFIENALHWIHEYHLDGLRLDATHTLTDDGPRHILAELVESVRASRQRPIAIFAEDHRNLSRMLLPSQEGGWGLDGVWVDDFHHQVRRCLTGDREGYFRDYTESLADLASTIRRGWLYCGQYSEHFKANRGSDPDDIPLRKFILSLQNHDQIGNRALGHRLNHDIDLPTYRAATVLLLCGPETPLLFMGQESAASSPFLYFSDHAPELGKRITEGRRAEFRHFSAFSDPDARGHIPDPQARSTFTASKLVWSERDTEPHRSILRLYQQLLRLRRCEPSLAGAARDRVEVVAVNDAALLLLRQPPPAEPAASAILALIQLRGHGRLNAHHSRMLGRLHAGTARSWAPILSTEDPDFCSDPAPLLIDVAQPAPVVEFQRPGAVLLRAVTG